MDISGLEQKVFERGIGSQTLNLISLQPLLIIKPKNYFTIIQKKLRIINVQGCSRSVIPTL